jgi:1-acyl-sn-glycerol-3-phosphate acyltransferase
MTTQDERTRRLNRRVVRTVELVLRLMYRYRIEGRENVPDDGPFMILYNEPSFLCQMLEMVTNTAVLEKPTAEEKVMYFIGEEMFSIEFFRRSFESDAAPARPSLPHGAGMLGASLLEVLGHLKEGGVWVSNPDGDMARDGRLLPMRGGVAWVGLHSAAPMVAIAPAINAYDTWPPWRMRPSPRGKLIARVGKPFRLTDTPLPKFTDEDLAKAKARIAAEMERLAYGPGGMAEWAGKPTMKGKPLDKPVDLRLAAKGVGVQVPSVSAANQAKGGMRSLWGRKLALLLWRCPVCLTSDALVHEHSLFRSDRLRCRACGTRWVVRRVEGRDFRLKVVKGPPDLVGLEMALTAWYDEMKRGFQPSPIPASGVKLEPGEELYLSTGGVKLVAYPSNSLLEGWAGREPPRNTLLKRSEAGRFEDLGTGELFLTNRRLVWEGPPGGLDFWWQYVTDVNLRIYFMMRINYGVTPYRFQFTQDSGLKWLTYAATLAQEAAAKEGRTVTASPF